MLMMSCYGSYNAGDCGYGGYNADDEWLRWLQR